MSERLILRLPEWVPPEATAEADQLSDHLVEHSSEQQKAAPWVILANDGSVKASGDSVDAALDEGIARGRQVIALAPGSAVSLHRVTPPAGARRNLQQALPYLLEEELAGDVETLHFALGPKLAGDQQAVAVVAREQLEGWLHWLQARSLNTRYIVPDLLCVPEPIAIESDPDVLEAEVQAMPVCQVIALGEQWLVRQGPWQGAVLEPSWADVWADSQQLMLPRPVPRTMDSGLAQLAEHLPAVPFSLLQGDYRPNQGLGKQWQAWRMTAVMACLVVVLQLVLGYQQLGQLKQSQIEYRQASEQIYRDLFGAKARIVNLKAQMRQQLQALQGDSEGQQDFFDLMLSLEPTLAQGGALEVKGLKYEARRNELRLDAQSGDFAGFEQFAAQLEQANASTNPLSVEQGALKRDREGKINGTLTIARAQR